MASAGYGNCPLQKKQMLNVPMQSVGDAPISHLIILVGLRRFALTIGYHNPDLANKHPE